MPTFPGTIFQWHCSLTQPGSFLHALALNNVTMSSNAADVADVPSAPPKLPSNVQIVYPFHQPLCHTILGVVSANGLHLSPRRLSEAEHYLWFANGGGPLDRDYSKWAGDRSGRQIMARIKKILFYYGIYDVSYPSELQVLAKRILDEMEADEVAITAAREEAAEEAAAQQRANDHHEGQLGLLPAARGTVPPSDPGASATSRDQAAAAAAFLGQQPRSRSSTGERKRKRKRSRRERMQAEMIFGPGYKFPEEVAEERAAEEEQERAVAAEMEHLDCLYDCY